MRFNLFGFKGELNPIRPKKKSKNREKDEVAVVGVGFKSCSEFGGSSRFEVLPNRMASEEKIKQNGSATTHLPPGIPKNWCGTTVPTSTKPIPPEGITIENETDDEPEVPRAPRKPDNWCGTKTPDPNDEGSIPIPNPTAKFDKVVKQKKPTTKPTVQHVFSNPKAEVQDSNKSTLISMTQSSDNDDSEDDFARTATKPPQTKSPNLKKSEPPQTKSPNLRKSEPTEIVRPESSGFSGYSDQAASIFFRSDSPEPEQRVRNFTIRKDDSDYDDNLSQTSA